MIQLDAATALALTKPEVTARPKVTWNLQGGVLDMTDRVVGGAMPRVAHDLGAYLSGEKFPGVTFELQNADNLLTPDDVSGSLLANKQPQDWFLDEIVYEIEVQRADGTWEAIPVFTGLVSDVLLDPGKVTVTAVPVLTYAKDTELPWEFTFTPTFILNAVSYFFAANTTVTYPAGFDQSFTSVLELLPSLDWNLYGTIKRGTTIGDASLLVAKSCMCSLWTTETGLIAAASEFPGQCGDFGIWPSYWPDPIRAEDGSDWRLSRPMDLAAREVVLQYQGVSVSWRSTAHEGNIGRLSRTVTAPYMAFSRQALLAARLLFEQYGNYPLVLSWTMGIRGLPIQLNDRVPVVDPWSGTLRTWRVVSKHVASMEMVRFEAVREGHESTVITNKTFAHWGTTGWNASGAEFL